MSEGRRAGRTFRSLLLELFVVFAGVYLAFQLDAYGEARAAAERRAHLADALSQEIAVFAAGADRLLPELGRLHAAWRTDYEAGRRPAPLTVEVGGADLPPRGMWRAVTSSDGLRLFGVETMQALSEYYNALDILLDKYETVGDFAERRIAPAAGVSAFYGEDAALTPEYAAYMRRVQDMIRLFRDVRDRADRCRTILGPAG